MRRREAQREVTCMNIVEFVLSYGRKQHIMKQFPPIKNKFKKKAGCSVYGLCVCEHTCLYMCLNTYYLHNRGVVIES